MVAWRSSLISATTAKDMPKKGYRWPESYRHNRSVLAKELIAKGRMRVPSSLGYRHTPEAKKKVSLASTGHSVSQQVRERLREAHTGKPKLKLRGENHYLWKGGITPINQAIRNSLELRLWREAIFKRDNWTCVFCGRRSRAAGAIILEADHIKPFALFPELRFAIDNGRTLCRDCHRQTSTYGVKSSHAV